MYLAVLVTLVFLVDLEVQRGGVVEDDLDIKVEQVGHAVVDGLLDGFLVRLQEVHGTVKLVQFETLRAGDADVFLQPLLMAVKLRGRGASAVGDQGKQGPFQVEAETPARRLLLQDGADAESIPNRFQGIDVAMRPGADQAPLIPSSNDLLR